MARTIYTGRRGFTRLEHLVAIGIVAGALALGFGSWMFLRISRVPPVRPVAHSSSPSRNLAKGYSRRVMELDISGLATLGPMLPKWKPDASLKEISDIWNKAGYRAIEKIDRQHKSTALSDDERIMQMLTESALWNYEGEPEKSYQVLEELRSFVGQNEELAKKMLATVIFYQGVSAMRQGENQNCIMCRGDSSCIIPISPTAIHTNPERLSACDQALHRIPRAVP